MIQWLAERQASETGGNCDCGKADETSEQMPCDAVRLLDQIETDSKGR